MKLSDALKLLDNEVESSSRNQCLITRQPIKNEIVMKCNHAYEYDALLKHFISTQNKYDYHKCPYCRSKYGNFIPYYQTSEPALLNGTELLNTINKTMFKKNDYIQCEHVFKSGKNKGKMCIKPGHKFCEGNLCFTHYAQKSEYLEKKKNSKKCNHILKNGNRCSCNMFCEKSGLCKRHYNMLNKNCD